MKNAPEKSLHAWIAAPDLPAALALELHLADLSPSRRKRGERWLVEVAGPLSVRRLETIVGRWLEEIGESATTIRVDDKLVQISARRRGPRRPHPAARRSFIG